MKWYSYLICLVIIVGAIFSTISLVDIWKQHSGVYGEPISIETTADYTTIAKFDYGIIEFESEDGQTYTNTTNYGFIDFDGTQGNYALLFNDTLLSNIEFMAGKVIGTMSMNFYATSGDYVCTVNLDINIEFFDGQTVVSLTLQNEDDSVAYFMQYMTINGAVFKIVERGAV